MKINLQQAAAFVASAECGSFSAAARFLNRAQSAISNAVANLETDLNVILFDRTHREPSLTIAGQALLPRAKQLLEQARALQAHADALSQNEEGKLILAIEESLMGDEVNALFCRFAKEFPFLALELLFPVKHDVLKLIIERRADIGLMQVIFNVPQDYKIITLGEIKHSAIVAPSHPLAHQGQCSFEALRQQRQLMLDSRGQEENTMDQISHQVWRIESQFALIGLVKSGLGWAWAPSHMVKEAIDKQQLVELKFQGDQQYHHLPIDMITGNHYVEGNAGRWLYQELSELSFLRQNKPS